MLASAHAQGVRRRKTLTTKRRSSVTPTSVRNLPAPAITTASGGTSWAATWRPPRSTRFAMRTPYPSTASQRRALPRSISGVSRVR